MPSEREGEDNIIRVGSRKSELALIQTKSVVGRLQELYPDKKFEIHTMSTIGDRVLNVSLPKIGEKSLFTRDLEDALRNGGVDFVVHSLKDLPTVLPTGMAIGAVLKREDARDALVLRKNLKSYTIDTLPKGSLIGTSSLRRTAQLRRLYPHVSVCDIRGNLNTRLAKLDAPDSKFAGIILAHAGLVRMGWINRISQVIEPTNILYAVGQGALAVECRATDQEILNMLQKLTCLSTTCRILAERSFLKTLGGGCSAPVAVWSKLSNIENSNKDIDLSLLGAVWSLDGAVEIRDELACCIGRETPQKRALCRGKANKIDSNSPPPAKRVRSVLNKDNKPQRSPPVINDDAEFKELANNVNELLEKHLAMKCPVIGKVDTGNNDNDKITASHCPVPITIGQDFMGQCPFVNDEAKVSFQTGTEYPIPFSAAETPLGKNSMPSTSKCPFVALHSRAKFEEISKSSNIDSKHESNTTLLSAVNCPFLIKTVQMFEYKDEEKPLPQLKDISLENVENLLCGLYQHACYNRELYMKSDKLGRELAEELIKKGALEVMASAQTEIHNKLN